MEAFETLGLDPTDDMTEKDIQRAHHISNTRAHPDKAPPDELTQQKAKESSHKINLLKDILELLGVNKNKLSNQSSYEDYKWGLGDEYRDGWGPDSGEEWL